MKKNALKKSLLAAFTLFASATITAGGGGGGDDDGLPFPDTCSANCGYENGSSPTIGSVSSQRGPYSVATSSVSSSVSGFGGGTIYYPSNLNGELATIAISPGFTAPQSAIAWWGPVLASNGFVVITIDTNSRFDQPVSRGRQLDSALSYLIDQGNNRNSPIFNKIDENRLATMGHSMGGGGALQSASRNRLSASLPMAPWTIGGNPYNQINVPTMIMACERDAVAPVGIHARPFYNRIPNSTDKALLELNNGNHSCANGGAGRDNSLLATYGVSWMKRFLDKDRRYQQFLCGPNHEANSGISDYRDNCNY
jgi:triacylglycerol lipase